MPTPSYSAAPLPITDLAAQLSAAQAPLKARYREDAGAAQLVLTAHGKVAQEKIACDVQTHLGTTRSGLHPAAGGDGALACSGDMLLQALIGCAGVTLAAVATAVGVAILDCKIEAAGDLDFRGTLGVDKTVAVGFTAIRMTFALDTDANDAQLETLKKLTDRYCVVYQTLAKGVPIQTTFARMAT
ncbi:MAG: OsmC family protein [Burkholderiales bacterium]